MNFFQKMKFFQTRNVFENEIISKIKLQKSRTCAQVRVFSQRVRGRARAQHKKFSACACVRVRIFKKFRVRGRARSRAPVPAHVSVLFGTMIGVVQLDGGNLIQSF